MVDLKCKLTSCKFNKNCNCKAKEVLIDQETNCTTYEKEARKLQKKDADMIVMPLIRTDVNTWCEAHCIFNKEGECVANGITVCTENKKAQCSTFLPK